ncbi:PCYCGC motif-containing (lipo)protein [Halobacillus sp. H74]|uniref:PCYCGC motif-containing (lipo)protein n=1 Tax=Halobacillus sp. H74 TaxID=3457436 RepID=UPI003FCC3F99
MKISWLLIISLVLGSGLAGCSSPQEEGGQQDSEESQTEHVHGDIREETASQDTLPAFMEEKPEEMQTLYKAVAQNKDLLENIPCYCGCGESVGHRDNYDCFVHENKKDGSIVWDDHGTKCGVCLEIAAQSIIDYQEGKSIEQIRRDIDSSYENGYGEPTPTPAL